MDHKRYIQNVFDWSEELRAMLNNEKVNQSDSIWNNLNDFSEKMYQIAELPNLDSIELMTLQTEVESLHDQLEEYFENRQQQGEIFLQNESVKIGNHQLPPLPYRYDALEPQISSEIMKLHHQKHHQSYVDGLNKAEKKLEEARKTKDSSLIKHWERELAFHGSGHYLHTIFWNNMKPNGGGIPKGKLLRAIENNFGSFEAFKWHFTEAAKQVEGVGWALLVWSPRSRRLEILQTEKHNVLTQWDTIPLLVLDVWEHAYYLQYKNNRGDYVKQWWSIVNWEDVEDRFEKASKLKWQPF